MVRALASVSAPMVVQRTRLGEGLVTKITFERPLSSVSSDVFLEVTQRFEGLVTVGTQVWSICVGIQ